MIVRIVFRLITHAIDDEERWRRLMSVLAPPLALILTLVVMVAWWLVGDGGLQLILNGLGPPTATPDEPTDMTTPA